MEKMKRTTDGASKMECGKQETQKTTNTSEKILAELMSICDGVISGEKKIDGTFFSTKTEAAKLKDACEKRDTGEVMVQLRSYHGEPSPRGLIERLEASMANKEEQAPIDTKCPMQIIMAPIKDIEPHPIVKDFYPIEPNMLAAMTESMKEHGYDPRFPVQATRTGNRYLVWDGLTRRRAALDAGIKNIPVMVSEFGSDDDLMEAVITAQNRRRSLSIQVLILSIERLLEIARRKAKANQGRRTDLLTSRSNEQEVETGGANEYIARLVGKSASTVRRFREIIENPMLKQKVMDGEISPHQAHKMLNPKKPSMAETLLFLDGKSSAGDGQVATVSPAGETGEESKTLELKDASQDDIPPADPAKAAQEPEQNHKQQVFPVPADVLTVLAHYFPKEHVGELEEHLAPCDPELVKFISSMLSGSKAA